MLYLVLVLFCYSSCCYCDYWRYLASHINTYKEYLDLEQKMKSIKITKMDYKCGPSYC